MYHVEGTVQEAGTLFGDGSHIIYVNGSYKDDADWILKIALVCHDVLYLQE